MKKNLAYLLAWVSYK